MTRRGGTGRRHAHGTRIVPGHAGIRRALIVAQVAASFMLLIGAGLTIRSLMKLTGVDPGFSTDHVLAMQLDMNFSRYTTDAQRAAFLDRVAMRLQEVPGVTAAGAVGALPFMQRTGIPAVSASRSRRRIPNRSSGRRSGSQARTTSERLASRCAKDARSRVATTSTTTTWSS